MKYAGFDARLQAVVVDYFVLLLFTAVFVYLPSISLALSAVAGVCYSMSGAFYNICLHGRFGQTVGKMVTNIKVISLDGSPISWRQALLRHSVDLALGILLSVSCCLAIFSVPEADYLTLNSMQRFQLIQEQGPHNLRWVHTATTVWVCSELLVLLFNKKRRGLHDFIAGTVVIYVE